jgi:hypothetical protein
VINYNALDMNRHFNRNKKRGNKVFIVKEKDFTPAIFEIRVFIQAHHDPSSILLWGFNKAPVHGFENVAVQITLQAGFAEL